MPNVTGMRLVSNSDGSYDIIKIREPERLVVSSSGSAMRPTWHRKYNERHSAVYVPGKEVNMYERIQSFTKQCDIVSLMARAKTDPSVLQQRQGFYGDFSAVGDMRDMLGAYNNMKGAFESLGTEEKSKLGGTFESFLSGVASGAFNSTAVPQGVTTEATEKEVSTNES